MKKCKRRVSIFTSHDWMKTLMWNLRNLEASSIFCCCINRSLASPIWDALHLLSEVCIKFTSSLPPDCRKRRIFGESLDNMRKFSSCVAAFMSQFSWKPFWCSTPGVHVLDFGVLLIYPVFTLAPSSIFSFSSFLFAADLWARCLIRTPPCVHVKRTFSLILHYRYFCWDSFLNWKYNYETL